MKTARNIACFSAITALGAGCGFRESESGPPPDCAEDSSATGGLIINELMATNAVSIADDEDNRFDWVELYNTTDQDISLCGWGITDDLSEPWRVAIEHETVVPARGHLLLWFSDGEEPASAKQMPLGLNQEGDEIGLTAPNGEFSDRVVFGNQATDFSAAREADGSDQWVIAWHVTPGEPNAESGPELTHTEDPSAPPEMAPAVGKLSDQSNLTGEIMGYDRMPEIGLRIDSEHISALEDAPDTYVPGFLVYDGREYGPVGIRLKGQNSFQPIGEKPSFRINIDEFVDNAKFFQLDDLTLNNMVEDFSMMHERLAYLVARQFGPASRANHALISLNGEFYGLYTNVETVKWHMLSRWYSDPYGALFEAEDVAHVPADIDSFDLEDGPDDRSLLRGLSEALTIESPDEALAAARDYVNMEQFRRYWAMSVMVGQFDGFPYSDPGDDYFAYADPETGKLQFLPWGMDETFYSGSYDVTQVHSRLAKKCLASTSCYQKFVDRTWEALDVVEDMDLAGERSRVAEQIAPYVAMDEKKPYSGEKVTEFQTQLRYFIEGRRTHLSEMLPEESSP